MKKIFFMSLVLCVIIFLTGCEQKLTFQFLQNEKWVVSAVADLNKGAFEGAGKLAGQVANSALDIDIPLEIFNLDLLLEPAMRLLDMSFQSQGIDFTWDYSLDKLRYSLRGNSYAILANNIPPEFFSISPLGNSQYRMVVDYSYLGEEYSLINSMIYDTTIKIKTGKIITSNANIQKENFAIWYNPTFIDVTFIPGNPFPFIPFASGGVALAFTIAAINLIKRGRRVSCPNCGHKIGKKLEICPHCDTWL